MTFTPTLADVELEAAIDIEITLAMKGATAGERVFGLEKAWELAKQRRPEMVEHIERSRGLRK